MHASYARPYLAHTHPHPHLRISFWSRCFIYLLSSTLRRCVLTRALYFLGYVHRETTTVNIFFCSFSLPLIFLLLDLRYVFMPRPRLVRSPWTASFCARAYVGWPPPVSVATSAPSLSFCFSRSSPLASPLRRLRCPPSFASVPPLFFFRFSSYFQSSSTFPQRPYLITNNGRRARVATYAQARSRRRPKKKEPKNQEPTN
ncbi:hypothetical protein PYCCODRAFT_880318 [Trametes coccinea BRFM310]|uniref:Transmembrane protein n=1 Tax=Trametes coccinea (strain BRFM310) TaxID=1353009 RepID=A0A1Y2IER2_TRAC3|nr:hypothetical protein PYCCODRAFT_880318 [Trametes coccinea BRFM310]